MDFSQAVASCFSKYATFSGRAARSEFWWFFVFQLVGSILCSIVDTILVSGGLGFALLGLLFGLATFLPSISVSVRRLHDLDRTGWWWWLVLVPIIGWIVLIVFYATKGTDGQNGYGPDPLATAAA